MINNKYVSFIIANNFNNYFHKLKKNVKYKDKEYLFAIEAPCLFGQIIL